MRQTGRVLVLRAFQSMAAAPSPKEPGQLVELTSPHFAKTGQPLDLEGIWSRMPSMQA